MSSNFDMSTKNNTSEHCMKKILIYDKNEDICKIMKRILDEEGYVTIKANSVDDLVCQINILHDDLDLILLDETVPTRVLTDNIMKNDHIKLIYLGEANIENYEQEGSLDIKNEIKFIQKPFEGYELIEKVRELVGE